ncbi:MAG: right-handed parallel beta-helix repeat-containing protein [Lachnospiraceae bacterium]|nr:right-handed parallel beta-helix repeat-containing protein [Lachnospiraceae bacterium]
MRIMKRWFALMLTMSLIFSDCDSITAFATGNDIAVETVVSEDDEESLQADEEETTVSDEVSEDNEFISMDETEEDEDSASETDEKTESQFVNIGQINAGDELPYPDDSEFTYDLPVSFEMSDSVLLFVHHNIDAITENEEGKLVWSILRGKTGTEEGSVCLINEEDNWADFEVVTDSPYFTMTENKDEESDYYKTAVLTAKDVESDEASEDYKDYNYYIRAVYYLEAEGEQTDEFYAAVTLPFCPKEDTNIDEAQDDTLDAENIDTDEIQGEESVMDESATEETGEEDIPDDTLPEESYSDPAVESIDINNANSELFENNDQQDLGESIEKLILYFENEANDKLMEPGDKRQIIARIESDDAQGEEGTVDPSKIIWGSSNKNIATVDKGLVLAKAEGYTQISAKYNGLTSFVKVEVASNGGTEKVLDLSGDIWVAGFQQESEDFVYTGQKITQDIRVYHNETLLKEKTDYTLTYKNNVNAAAYDSAKAPSVTIKLKGQYSGSRTLYFTIKQRKLNDGMSYEQVVSYAKTLKIPAPTLYYNNKKLASNKDFTCDYSTLPEEYKKGDSYTKGTPYKYKVIGIGNFTGEFEMSLVVLDDKSLNMESATVTLDRKQYEYHGKPLSTEDVHITSVKLGKNGTLDSSLYEYSVYADGVGTGYIEVYPSDAGRDKNYRGMKKVNIKVVGDRQLKNAKTVDGWQDTIVFSQKRLSDDGGIIQEKEGVLVYAGEGVSEPVPLKEGMDYTVKYSNHKKVGTATATFTGMGRYTGTLKIKYKITPNINEENFTIVWKNVKKVVTAEEETFETPYQKGGAVPDFVLMDQDENILNNKTDYTVKLTDNKSAGSTMTCTITGKGNYSGYSVRKKIKVTTGDLERQAAISISDKQYSEKANAWQSKPTIKDANGKKLVEGTDYDKIQASDYSYDNMTSGEAPKAGTTVRITVHGINNYAGSNITGAYRIYQTSISKLKVTIDAQEYTGNEITLTKNDIHVYATSSDQKKKENELPGTCYEILKGEYKNNIKAGTAKVTLRGLGEYGGTKTYSFKINKKTYRINQIKGIMLDKTDLLLSIQGDNTEKGKLTATIISAYEKESLTNPTVIWTTSNSNIATVESGQIVENKTGNGVISTTVTAQIMLKKEGSVTITATTQDGNKKAKCTVEIVDVPILKDADKSIVMNVDDTYKLRFENDDIQEQDLSGIKWEISNSDVVSLNIEERLLTAKKAGAAILKLTKGKYVQQCYVIVEGADDIPENYLDYSEYIQMDDYIYDYDASTATDDTYGIVKCIKYANHTKNRGAFVYDGVYIPAGVYWIDATANWNCGIFLDGRDPRVTWDPLEARDYFEVRMSPGALLMTIGNSESDDFHVIKIEGCSNVTISGGTIIGERNEHIGTDDSESGHGVGIYDCTNIHIQDMDISQCWGDGIYLGRSYQSTADNIDINITGCNVHHNRRNNLGIVSADGVTIDDCHFNYAKGTDPQYGIDIETNDDIPCKNITITNTEIVGNAKGSMGIIKKADNVRLEDCTLSGNFYNQAGTNVVLKNVKFLKGSVIDGNGCKTTIIN